MRKIFIRAGALLMAAFVLMSAIVTVVPMQVSAASLYSLEDLPAFPTEYSSGLNYNSYLCFVDGDGTPTLFACTTSWSSTIWDGSALVVTATNSRNFGLYVLSGDAWYQQTKADATFNKSFSLYNSDPSSILQYTQVNVAKNIYDSEGNLFFPPPPPGPLEEVMMDLQDQGVLDQVLMGVLQMIPIGLACWVGYKGLRKALALLQGILYKA